jgi:transposase-like protein
LIYDGTYFHKNGCLICLMNASTQKIIASTYADREGFKSTYPWFEHLKQRGLSPDAVAMDGEISVLRALRMVWPKAKVQRCLFHIQREGMRWLRTHPKTQAGQELKELLSTLCYVKSFKERRIFVHAFDQWIERHNEFVQSLPQTEVAFKDLKRTIVLIKNALPDMFSYFGHSLPATTNMLESFYSRLKADYRRHRGLSQKNKIGYLKWYCYYKNSNTS